MSHHTSWESVIYLVMFTSLDLVLLSRLAPFYYAVYEVFTSLLLGHWVQRAGVSWEDCTVHLTRTAVRLGVFTRFFHIPLKIGNALPLVDQDSTHMLS
jgi:hypothetical protein